MCADEAYDALLLVAFAVVVALLGLLAGRRWRAKPLRAVQKAVEVKPCHQEEVVIRQLRTHFERSREEPPDHLLPQLAWSRSLDVAAAIDLWHRHVAATRHLRIQDVSDEAVRKAYDAGFCVRSGFDVDGRPMIWVRMALSVPSTMTASLVVKNTWMAQDATLAGGIECSRKGICFVYDLKGVGLKNVTFDPLSLRAAIWGALCHPSHISRVWFLDAPKIFLLTWQAFKHFVPKDIRSLVRFANTGRRDSPLCFSEICPSSQLPAYLGGMRFSQPFCNWMFAQLQGHKFAYRSPQLHLPVPMRRSSSGSRRSSCLVGLRRLSICVCNP